MIQPFSHCHRRDHWGLFSISYITVSMTENELVCAISFSDGYISYRSYSSVGLLSDKDQP